MSVHQFLDFDLLIEEFQDGYRARLLNSPAGQSSCTFALPFSELELENLLLRVGRRRGGTRRLESTELEAAKNFGARLFEAVFNEDMLASLRSSLDIAAEREAGLRVRLRLQEVPELADVPWEYLYNRPVNRFLALSSQTPVVRFLDMPERIQPLRVEPPLRVLVMISSPVDYPELDSESEARKLHSSLGDLENAGLVAVKVLETPTLAALQQQLRRGDYHVFHFIGHGGFDKQAQDGTLLFETESERGRPVTGQELGTLLHDHRSLRLAVLNACEGARSSRTDPFAGVAQTLVQQGIPAVIAMQFEITDRAAITFGREFYAAIADSYPVDAALAEARKAIFSGENDIEWGTPVLYMRAPDGRIFDIVAAHPRLTVLPGSAAASVHGTVKEASLSRFRRALQTRAFKVLLGLLALTVAVGLAVRQVMIDRSDVSTQSSTMVPSEADREPGVYLESAVEAGEILTSEVVVIVEGEPPTVRPTLISDVRGFCLEVDRPRGHRLLWTELVTTCRAP